MFAKFYNFYRHRNNTSNTPTYSHIQSFMLLSKCISLKKTAEAHSNTPLKIQERIIFTVCAVKQYKCICSRSCNNQKEKQPGASLRPEELQLQTSSSSYTADSLQPPFYLCAGKRITRAEIKRLSSLKCTATKRKKQNSEDCLLVARYQHAIYRLQCSVRISGLKWIILRFYYIHTIFSPTKHNNKQIWPPVHKTI